jgi:8-oxo-dGTP pyrophosphatase MutT (NUDIX family)
VTAADERYRSALSPLPMAWEPGPERRAAVIAPIAAARGEDWLCFTVRRADLREHAGQVSFPGGVDDGDADPAACALRELQEELGVDPATVLLFGHLGASISSSRYRVHCLVGRIPWPDAERVARSEVERLLCLPLVQLADLGRWQEIAPAPAPDGRTYAASPHFRAGDDVIWGLTGRFTFAFAQALARTDGGR